MIITHTHCLNPLEKLAFYRSQAATSLIEERKFSMFEVQYIQLNGVHREHMQGILSHG